MQVGPTFIGIYIWWRSIVYVWYAQRTPACCWDNDRVFDCLWVKWWPMNNYERETEWMEVAMTNSYRSASWRLSSVCGPVERGRCAKTTSPVATAGHDRNDKKPVASVRANNIMHRGSIPGIVDTGRISRPGPARGPYTSHTPSIITQQCPREQSFICCIRAPPPCIIHKISPSFPYTSRFAVTCRWIFSGTRPSPVAANRRRARRRSLR